MIIDHHPSEEILLDYASGALGESWSIAVATHLALCPMCRRSVEKMEEIGGVLLEGDPQDQAVDQAFDDLLDKIDQLDTQTDATGAISETSKTDRAVGDNIVFPRPLRDYLGGDVDSVSWQRLGLGAYQYVLPTADSSATARLLRIPARKPVPEHSHGGLELTLVLSGSFSDATGTFGRGDLQEADQSIQHTPVAAPGDDCVCLAVTDAPLQFKSFAARVVQPFLGI